MLTTILYIIAGLMALGLVSIVYKYVQASRKLDRELDAMRRILDASSASIYEAIEEMARVAQRHVHVMSIHAALELSIPVMFVSYEDPPKAEWIGHIDEEGNILIYDNIGLKGDYIDSVTLSGDELEIIFESIKGSLSLCAAEAKRRQEEDGVPSDLIYMQGWVKANLLTPAT